MTHRFTEFTITTRATFEGHKLWGFATIVNGQTRGQRPCWYTQREAIESTRFHIDLWSKAA